VDWGRINLTEHMTEAAALVAECQVAFDFSPTERALYEIKVYESLKGGSGERYFAIGTNRDDPAGFRPLGSAGTPEDALQACLGNAGIYHRRRVKQAED
jgi:hypothetical protein